MQQTPTKFCQHAATQHGLAVVLRYATAATRSAVMEFKKRGYAVEGKDSAQVFEIFHLKRVVLVEVGTRPARGGFDVRVFVDGRDVKPEKLIETINKALTAKEFPEDDDF